MKSNTLKRLRRDAGITQHALARATGVHRWRISHAELGWLKLTTQEVELIRNTLVEAVRRKSARVLKPRDEGEPAGCLGKPRLRS
jgi:predicted transcriptional regulator